MKTILRYCVAIGMVLFLAITGMATPAYAFKQSDVDKLLSSKVCPKCDLSGANLSGKNLNGVNLEGANLQGANISKAILDNANLQNANLKDTNLSQTYMDSANLTGATGTTSEQIYSAFWYDLTLPDGYFMST